MEKVVIIVCFFEKEYIKLNNIIMLVLVYCFMYLVGVVEDICMLVYLRVVYMLGIIRVCLLKVFYKCIEY